MALEETYLEGYQVDKLRRFGKDVLKTIRKNSLQKTQIEIANEIGVSQSTISKWETGRGVPKSPSELEKAARFYSLKSHDVKYWKTIAFLHRETPEFLSGQLVVEAERVIDELVRLLHSNQLDYPYNYFRPNLQSDAFQQIEKTWESLDSLASELLKAGENIKRAGGILIVDLASLLIHYLHTYGFHRKRLELTTRAAMAAEELGIQEKGAWLMGDAIPFTLGEMYFDLEGAEASLMKVKQVFKNITDPDLLGLISAFEAWGLQRLGQSDEAVEKIKEVLDGEYSSPAHARIFRAAGEIYRIDKQYEKSILFHEAGKEKDLEFIPTQIPLSANVRIAGTYLESGEVNIAKETYKKVVETLEKSKLLPYELAMAKYGLALIDEAQDNHSKAYEEAWEAYKLLKEMNISPHLKDKIITMLHKIREAS